MKPPVMPPNRVVQEGGRSPGRPRTVCVSGDAGSRVTVYLPTEYHNRLTQLAAARDDKSVSAVVRQLLILRLS